MKLNVLDQPGAKPESCGPGPSVCEACGAEFSCGAALAGCWCGEIKLSSEALSALRARYAGCLCRNCLESLADVVDENNG